MHGELEAQVETGLSERLGERVAIRKVANRVTVYRYVEVGVPLGEVYEQELYAAEDPVSLLQHACEDQPRPRPPVLVIGREDAHLLLRVHGRQGEVSALGVLLDGEVYGFWTVTSGPCASPELARDRLSDQLVGITQNLDVTVVSLGGGKESGDALLGRYHAWMDMALVDGSVVLDSETRKLLRS